MPRFLIARASALLASVMLTALVVQQSATIPVASGSAPLAQMIRVA